MFIEEPCQAQNHDVMAEIARGTSSAHRHGRARLHQVGLSRSAGEEGRHDPAARYVPRGRHHRSAPDRGHGRGLLRRPSRRTIRSGRSRSRPACRWPPAFRISCVRNRSRSARAISRSRSKSAKAISICRPGPGLGIELDENAMADKIGHDWRNQESYDAEDGSVVDW